MPFRLTYFFICGIITEYIMSFGGEKMLDIRFICDNPELVKENIKKKFKDSKLPLVDEVIELDAEARKTQQEADALRADRNKLSKQIGALMGQGKKDEAEEVKKQVNAQAARLEELAEKEKSRFKGCELAGKTLGVIGLGAIGIKVANMALYLAMEVI